MGHFYTKNGKPAYTVPKASGNGTRKTTISDARKLELQPSVTEVIGVLDKPALTDWLIKQAIAKERGEPFVDGKEKAKEGTLIHDAIEEYFQSGKKNKKYAKHIGAVVACLKKEYPDVDDWVAEKSFSTGVGGFGGKVDLHSPSHRVVVDFKTKDFTEDTAEKLAVYDDHAMQLGGYYEGLFGDTVISSPDCMNIFISRDVPGLVYPIRHTPEDIKRGLGMLLPLVTFWYRKKRYFNEENV